MVTVRLVGKMRSIEDELFVEAMNLARLDAAGEVQYQDFNETPVQLKAPQTGQDDWQDSEKGESILQMQDQPMASVEFGKGEPREEMYGTASELYQIGKSNVAPGPAPHHAWGSGVGVSDAWMRPKTCEKESRERRCTTRRL
jgi:hypothetical protein